MKTEKFLEKYVPKKYHEMIEEIEMPEDGGEGYWIYLKDGYRNEDTDTKMIHEYTIKDVKAKFKYIVKEEIAEIEEEPVFLHEINKVKNSSIVGSTDLVEYELQNGDKVIATNDERMKILNRKKGEIIIITPKNDSSVSQKAYFLKGKLAGFLPTDPEDKSEQHLINWALGHSRKFINNGYSEASAYEEVYKEIEFGFEQSGYMKFFYRPMKQKPTELISITPSEFEMFANFADRFPRKEVL